MLILIQKLLSEVSHIGSFHKNTSKKSMEKEEGCSVRSRKHCVLFQEEMVKQMKERNLSTVV